MQYDLASRTSTYERRREVIPEAAVKNHLGFLLRRQ
jgi:hypothetical protein